jgi:hypothetical protein
LGAKSHTNPMIKLAKNWAILKVDDKYPNNLPVIAASIILYYIHIYILSWYTKMMNIPV